MFVKLKINSIEKTNLKFKKFFYFLKKKKNKIAMTIKNGFDGNLLILVKYSLIGNKELKKINQSSI